MYTAPAKRSFELMKITHQLGFTRTVDETYSQCANSGAGSRRHQLILRLVAAESCAIMSLFRPAKYYKLRDTSSDR